jgi:hypothetical protein
MSHRIFRSSSIPRWSALVLFTVASALAQDHGTNSGNNLKNRLHGTDCYRAGCGCGRRHGMTFAFSEGQGKRQLTGLLFGGAMAMGAVRLMAWIFT